MDKRIESRDFASIVKRISRNISLLLGAMGFSLILGFLTAALNARALGEVGLGVITLYHVTATLMGGIFYLGTQQPVIKLGKQALERGDLTTVGRIASLSLIADTLAALIGGTISLLLVLLVPNWLGIDDEMSVPALVYTAVVFTSGTAASNGILRLFDYFRYIGIFQVCMAALILGSAIWLYRNDSPVQSYLIANAIIYSSFAVAQNLFAVRVLTKANCPLKLRSDLFAWGFLKDFLAYAWTTNATSTLEILVRQSDAILLNYFFGVATVGIYGVVKQVGGVLNKLIGPISSAVFPEVATLAATGDRASAFRLMRRLAVFGLAAGCCGALFMMLIGRQILNWGFGPAFASGYIPLLVVMFAVSLRLTYATLGGFVQAFYTPEKLFIVYVLGFVTYFAIAPALIYTMGMSGAALGQAIFVLSMLVYSWNLLVRKLREPHNLQAVA